MVGTGGRILGNLRRAIELRAMTPYERIEVLILLVVVTMAAGCEIDARLYGIAPPSSALAERFSTFAILGALLSIVIAARSRAQLLTVLGAAAAAILAAQGPFRGLFVGRCDDLLHVVSFAGAAAAVPVQLLWVALGRPERARARAFVLYRAGLFVIPTSFAPFFLAHTQSLVTYDPALLRFDDALGIRVASLAALIVAAPRFNNFISLVYSSVVAALAVHEALRERSGACGGMTVPFILAAFFGFVLYELFPVAGPAAFVPDYYGAIWPSPGAATYAVIDPNIQRNCMPSVHSAFAYLLLMKAREHRNPWPRAIAIAFAFFTVWGALTWGNHWFVDIVVAMPFTVAIFAIAEPGRQGELTMRLPVAAAGAAIAGAWLVLLARAPHMSMFAAWAMVASTALASCGLYWRLRGPDRPPVLANRGVRA